MWIERQISALLIGLEPHNKQFVTFLMGPRQCGKSSLLVHHLSNDWIEVSFDDLEIRRNAQSDPHFFLNFYKNKNIIIDEAQYAPALFHEIKRMIDLKKRSRLSGFEKKSDPYPNKIYLTGSNRIFMENKVHESLAGRAHFLEMNTLSTSELLNWNPEIDIIDIIYHGGWPEVYAQKLNVVPYLNDYLRSAVEKDIALVNGVQKVDDFMRALQLLANRTGELLNYENLSKDCGVSANTLREWVSFLHRMGIIGLLRPYHSNLNKRLTKQPKIYFLDTGLAVRLQGYSSIESLKSNPRLGSLFETLVCAEIIKVRMNFNLSFQVFLWRSKDGEEIDFLIETAEKIILIEVKMGYQNAPHFRVPPSILAVAKGREIVQMTVTLAGTHPISSLKDFLLKTLSQD